MRRISMILSAGLMFATAAQADTLRYSVQSDETARIQITSMASAPVLVYSETNVGDTLSNRTIVQYGKPWAHLAVVGTYTVSATRYLYGAGIRHGMSGVMAGVNADGDPLAIGYWTAKYRDWSTSGYIDYKQDTDTTGRVDLMYSLSKHWAVGVEYKHFADNISGKVSIIY
jgi:hypothetical protein